MKTLTWKDSEKFARLKEKFPQLWANHKKEFHQFFNPDGTMNNNGYRAYDVLKKARRERMSKT